MLHRPKRSFGTFRLFAMLLLICPSLIVVAQDQATSEDWPMWRYDACRSAASPNSLPSDYQLLWKRSFSRRVQAWDDPLNLDLMPYDKLFEPVVSNGRMFIPFNDQDKLLAIDCRSGETLWTFYAEGPIRFAPAVWNDTVLVASDDGYLYSLAAQDGSLRWKFTGAPNSQHVLGNRRLISAWPMRGAPVVSENKVYVANGIWPFMGTFLCELDADTGRLNWVNDSTGSQFIKQPHSALAFAGVAPQGCLVATSKWLIVPGGRSVPAVFDRATGEFRYFELNAGGKGTGGAFVAADETQFFVHTRLKGTRAFDLETGLKTAFTPNEPVITKEMLFASREVEGKNFVEAYPLEIGDSRERTPLWSCEMDASEDLILAKDHLIGANPSGITIAKILRDPTGKPTGAEIVKTLATPEKISRLLVANKTLFGVSDRGSLFAFGEGLFQVAKAPSFTDSDGSSSIIEPLIQYVREKERAQGYAIWFGDCSNRWLEGWIKHSPYEQLAIILQDGARAREIRERLDLRGKLGPITVHVSDAVGFRAPPYIAHQVFVGDDLTDKLTDQSTAALYASVRPYGGTMHLLTDDKKTVLNKVQRIDLEQAAITETPWGVCVKREGALPGSADWTHQYGDVANTKKSNDRRVKLPLGVLWFGASSNMDVLPRHGHGPPEQVVGGRVFIEGINTLSARDVYTGRVLWKRQFEDLGTFDVYYDATYEDKPLDPKYNQVHIPGANGRGTNYIVTEDRIYVIEKDLCRCLDPETGADIGEIRLPSDANGESPEWGYIGVYKNILLGGVGFAKYRSKMNLEFPEDEKLKASKKGFGAKSLDRAASLALIGFDRHTGEMLWKVDANHSFWHNGIVAGGDKVYLLDKNPTKVEEAMKRRGLSLPQSYRVLAVDFQTGNPIWEANENIFGTWLGYSERHDALLLAGANASDRLADEVGQGMRVYMASQGKVLWEKEKLKYSGPCILHNDWIITNTNAYAESAGAFHIRTGEQKMSMNPITGKPEPWKITRTYGCNSITASENFLTFRSGAAGYYDLETDSGTGNFGGFRSGCTSNLVVANGVLNAPDYTRTCSCSYQNQTSLALVHMPEIEQWTVHPATTNLPADTAIEALGVNLGAPGDRRDANGLIWVEYPHRGAETSPFVIDINPEAKVVQYQSSRIAGAENPWLYCSGLVGVREIKLQLLTIEIVKEKNSSSDDDDPSKKSAAKTDSKSPKSESTEAKPLTEPEPKKRSDKTLPRATYQVELYFTRPLEQSVAPEFDVAIQGYAVESGLQFGSERTLATRHTIQAENEITITLTSKSGEPIFSGIKIQKLK